MDKYIKRLLSFFDHIIKKENIDFILYENISNVFSNSSYLAAKENGIFYLGLKNARIPGRFDIWFDKYPNLDKLRKDFNSFNINEINKKEKDYITSYMKNIKDVKPDFLENHIKSYKQKYLKYYFNKLDIVKEFFKYHFNYYEDSKGSVEIGNVFNQAYQSVKRHFHRKIKIKLLEKKFSDNNCSTDKYYLYPIHFQPESSTSINAQYFDNQIELIKNIVFSLPLNTKLYVKDHPHAYGYFPMDFYKKIKKLPNVNLIHCAENVNELINQSEGIITLTSTMGFEALMNEKPIISFGKVFYNIHPYCYNLNNIEELYDTIKIIRNSSHNNFNKYNLKLLHSHYINTYDGKLVIYNKTETEMNKIYRNIRDVMFDLKENGENY